MNQHIEQFKDSEFYDLLDKWGLLKDKTSISNMMKKAIDHFKESKSKEFDILSAFLTDLMKNTKGGYKKLRTVPTNLFVQSLTPIEILPEAVILNIFQCSLQANLDLINSKFDETSILEAIDRNNLKNLDLRKVINKNDFENEGAANEFYLVFAWFLYMVAMDNDVGPLPLDKLV